MLGMMNLLIYAAFARIPIGVAIATTTGGTDTRLGAQFNSHGEYFAGDFDNLRIYDSAISASELANTPEPSSLILAALGAGLAAAVRRSKA